MVCSYERKKFTTEDLGSISYDMGRFVVHVTRMLAAYVAGDGRILG